MKTRSGFVSNSSTSSFCIHNRSHEPKTLLDFVKELLEECHEDDGAIYDQLDEVGSWHCEEDDDSTHAEAVHECMLDTAMRMKFLVPWNVQEHLDDEGKVSTYQSYDYVIPIRGGRRLWHAMSHELWRGGQQNLYVPFGTDDGDILGKVLCDGLGQWGSTKSFNWTEKHSR